ncbi:MAG: RICIN domain-containing protein [Planctomycetota bacterium]
MSSERYQPRLRIFGGKEMVCRPILGVLSWLACLSVTAHCSLGQVVIRPNGGFGNAGQASSYQLYDGNNQLKSTVTSINENQLMILADGSPMYRYSRNRRFDTRFYLGYYNQTADEVIRWPRSNSGHLEIGDPDRFGNYVFHQGYHIGRLARNNSPWPDPGQGKRSKIVVIESALPGGGLVTAGYGRGGNVQIGNANPSAAENQFYLQEESRGYVSLVPVADQDLIVDIPDARADNGANVHVWQRGNNHPQAIQFRLRGAERGYFYLETKLRRGFVWTVDGDAARQGSNIRLARQTGRKSQMFRLSSPENVGQVAGGQGYAPRQPAQTVTLKLANSQVFELWVLMIDRRDPLNPRRIKIPPQSAVSVELLDGAGESQLFHELSVYKLVRQSMVIDKTRPGPAVITEENYSPKSVGWFQVPFAKQESGGTLDAYRKAVDSYNPGKVVRIEPSRWRSLKQPSTPPVPTNDGAGEGDREDDDMDDDSPFGVASQPSPSYRNTDLAVYLNLDDPDRVAPMGDLPLCLVQMMDDNRLSVEQIIWQRATTVETTPRTIDGKTVEVSEQVVKDVLSTWPHTLAFEQIEVFLPTGRLLSRAEARTALKSEVPAVILQSEWIGRLDEQFLSLLKPTTPIIASGVAPDGGGPPSPSRLEQRQLPSTHIAFRGLRKSPRGGVELLSLEPETLEQEFIVEVPVEYEVEIDGQQQTKTKMVAEQRTRMVTVLNEKARRLAPKSYRLYEMAGKKLSAEATDRFAQPQAVVYVPKGKIVDPWYRQVLRAETVLLIER